MFGLMVLTHSFLIVIIALLIYRLLDRELIISAYKDALAQITKDMEDFNRVNNEKICSNK